MSEQAADAPKETAVVVAAPSAQITIWGTDDPAGIVERAALIGGALGQAIKKQGMSTQIQGREYVLAEGWAFMGSLLGVFPRTLSVTDGPEGYEAHVELVTRDGSVVGGAIAECSYNEKSWADREAYALKSMAQTRATGKAYRMAFGFVMKAAGYEATSAEEMPPEGAQKAKGRANARSRYPWVDDFAKKLADADLPATVVAEFLEVDPPENKAQLAAKIDEWLNEGSTLDELIEGAAPLTEDLPAG